METLLQDMKFAVRTLRTNPGFTAVAVLILALGIGATTAVFSVVNAVLLRPLPYPEPSRLVALSGVFRPAAENRRIRVVAQTDVQAWRAASRTLSSMGAFFFTQLPVRIGGQAYSPITALVEPQFLPTLGNELALGTHFDQQAAPGADPTAIISHAFWLDAFGGDPGVVGRSIVVDGQGYTVRGVLARQFQFPRSDASYFTKPIALLLPAFSPYLGQSQQWFAIARLAPEVTLDQAQAELEAIAQGLGREHPRKADWSVVLTPLQEETTRASRTALLVSLGIVAVLMLIASTNLMNLFFSRGVVRLREMAIRKAVGGTTGRLIRQLLTESLCLAVLGGWGGVLIALFAIDALVALSPIHLPVNEQIDIDVRVLAFTWAVCVSAALAAGLFPAIHVSLRAEDAVRSPGTRATTGRGLARLQQGLCIAQMALGAALLVAAGLLTHSLWRLNSVDPGFAIEHILGFQLSVPNDQDMDARKRFYREALDEIQRLPGVQSAGLISFLPPETRAGVFMPLRVEGDQRPPDAPRTANTLIASPGYFSTMGMPVVRGRGLSNTDSAGSSPVALVNQTLASRFFGGEDPIGRRINTGFDGKSPREIVGVVSDTRDRGLGRDPFPTVYLPFEQFALPYGSIAVRTHAAPLGLVPEIRERLQRLNPAVPVTEFQTVDARIRESLREPRFYTAMAVACAVLAVLFVTLGLYGIVSYSVSRRTPEFGIRMAMGARQGTILRLVLWQGLKMAAGGVALGLAISMLLTSWLASLLFEVQPGDPLTLAAVALLVTGVTLLASYLPARRASRVNPVVALRAE